MEEEVVKTVHHPDGDRKVEIFRRADGSFGFEAWKFLKDENAWAITGPHSISFIETLERAEREARERVSWLKEIESSTEEG